MLALAFFLHLYERTSSMAIDQKILTSIGRLKYGNVSEDLRQVLYTIGSLIGSGGGGGASLASPSAVVVPATTTSASSATSPQLNSRILRVTLTLKTTYTAGATVQVGSTGNNSLLVGPADFSLQQTTPTVKTFQYGSVFQSGPANSWPASPIVVTVGGSPTAGALDVYVEYVPVPNT